MIDTIVLTLNSNTFDRIANPDGQKWELYSRGGAYQKYIKQHTAAQKKDGKTRPRMRVIKRGEGFALQLECSLPKMMWGDNVNELCDADFPDVLEMLHNRLLEQDIFASKEHLRNAVVSSVHFGKNIVLEDSYSVQPILSDLAKVNLPQYLNITRDRYPDAGHALHLAHTKNHELVFYDKVKDLNKTKPRAVDKEQTQKQFSLFDWKKVELVPEILRIEARYGDKRQVRQAVFGPKSKEEVRFKDVFSHSVAMAALRREWGAIKSKSVSIFTSPVQPQTMLELILRRKIAKDAKEAIYLAGLAMLSKDADGMRGFRATLARSYSRETWHRRVLEDIKRIEGVFPEYGWIGQIDRALEHYEPLRVSTGTFGM